MGYLDVLNGINKITDIAGNGLNALSNIFGSSDTSPKSIKDKYLNGFTGETNQFTPNVFARIFDEPTYLTFRIVFEKGETNNNNIVSNSKIYGTNYDNLPEPLLAKPSSNNATKNYSSVYYLKNVLGEHKRAQLLDTFIDELFDIQKNYPYYFQSIEGLNNLLSVRPESGIRINDENNIITISCLEGLDLKITQLMQIYRKCVWDDVYQRWILPDMMRYFNMKIYISEIRLFHSMSKSTSQYNKSFMYDLSKGEIRNATSRDKLKSANALETAANFLNAASAVSNNFLGTNSTISKALNYTATTAATVENIKQNVSNNVLRLCNNAINAVMPTILIDCHMCEFVLDDDIFENISTLHAYRSKPTTAKLKIKVNKVFEKQIYPLNNTLAISSDNKYIASKRMLMDDYRLMKDDNLKSNREVLDSSDGKRVDGIDEHELISLFRMSDVITNADFSNSDSKGLSYRISYNDAEDTLKALTMQLLNTFVNTPLSKAVSHNVQFISNEETNRKNINDTLLNNSLGEFTVNRPGPSEELNNNLNIGEFTVNRPDSSEKLFDNDENDSLRNFPNKRDVPSNMQSTAVGNSIKSAIETLSELTNYIKNSKEIESMQLSDNDKEVVQSILFNNILTEISRSKATSENIALIELSKKLLNEIDDKNIRSKATNNKSAFENLNS